MDAIELNAENNRLRRELESSRAQHQAERAQHEAIVAEYLLTLDEKARQVASLERRIVDLIRQLRGSRQERIDVDQLMLFSLEELQQIADELEQQKQEQSDALGEHAENQPEEDADSSDVAEPQPPKPPGNSGGKSSGRRPLPKHLPREIRRHELAAEALACPCCGEARQEFAVESSEQPEFVPGYWKVIQHDRVKYVCKACEEQVIVAPKPPQPIEKGLPGPGLAAHTTLSKFGDHTPLYRQEDIHSRIGWTIRRSTLCGWLFELAWLTAPLVMRMKYLLLQSKVIHTDDTKIKMLQPGVGICKEAKFWPYLGDWLHPYAVYDFTLDRTRGGPQSFLAGYRGYLQADAYSGYDGIYAPGDVFEVACWVHARRYWYKVKDLDPPRVTRALSYITRLFQVEDQLRESYAVVNSKGERDFAAIAAARQQYASPILAEFRSWLESESQSKRILPKSDLRSAFTYTLNQWDALCRYTEAGYLSMDNNVAERLCKIAAIGRNNYLFVGNERGGRAAAIHYSMVSSAKANGVEPFAWLRDCYERLASYRGGEAFKQWSEGQPLTSSELDEFLPDVWLSKHPEHRWEIDEVRRRERESAERRKRRARLTRRRT